MPSGRSGIAYECLLMVNCYNGGSIGGVGDAFSGGLCSGVKDQHTSQIINSCNFGTIKSGEYNWNGAEGFVTTVFSGHLDVINSCSAGDVIITAPDGKVRGNNFAGFATGATGNFENCYYKESIVDGIDVKANENTIPITKETAQTALNSLNEYVEEHKNDYYEEYGVQLVNWKMGTNGYPTLDLKY